MVKRPTVTAQLAGQFLDAARDVLRTKETLDADNVPVPVALAVAIDKLRKATAALGRTRDG